MTERIVGVIGGTGIGERLAGRSGAERIDAQTPFGRPSGPILKANVDGVTCLFLSRHGEGHLIIPSAVPYRANIFALKSLGATHVIASGATGSLREELAPGELVICDQVIDKTHQRKTTFFDEGLVAHVEMSDPFCQPLREALLQSAESIGAKAHDGGTYVCMEGPQFSTRAEALMHRAWGGDLIGMTCMPEAKLAREAEMCYALVALPTDYDCWRPHPPGADKSTLLAEIVSNMQHASEAAIALIEAVIKRLATGPLNDCSCQNALELAIWSDKSAVDAATIERLQPLIGRYFSKES